MDAADANGTGSEPGASPLGTDARPAPVKLLAWILVVLALGSALLGLIYALGGT